MQGEHAGKGVATESHSVQCSFGMCVMCRASVRGSDRAVRLVCHVSCAMCHVQMLNDHDQSEKNTTFKSFPAGHHWPGGVPSSAVLSFARG